jgi:hypothetical protein
VPRSQLRYRRLEFPALNARQRAEAARIAVGRDALPGALSRVAWKGPVAHVWSWTPPANASARERTGWLPESLLRRPPANDGPRLVRQMEGFEGQIWRGGDLAASQWWPAPPPPAPWQRFLRSAGLGLDGGDNVPMACEAAWSQPWARLRGGNARSEQVESTVWRVVLVLVVSTLGWQWAALGAEREALHTLVRRTEQLRTAAMPLLDARERADTGRETMRRFGALQRGASDYSLMAAVRAPLGEDARLLAWSRQGDQLKVKVQSKETDPRAFVRAYESVSVFGDVQAAPAKPEGMLLEFKLPEAFKVGSTP